MGIGDVENPTTNRDEIKCNSIAMQLSCEFCHIRGGFAKSESQTGASGEDRESAEDGVHREAGRRATDGGHTAVASVQVARKSLGNRLTQRGVGDTNLSRNQFELQERVGNPLLRRQQGR
ncbi:hypothetical protein PCO31010_00363 [Pandoraea commovens]|uniref:Uncharacterized protein n=1 Tax=Pandoraea commovens TaxID=2508289 RepID=A0A5E4RTP4_9BURK|nr:hypothetical protein PCO31010_00363 [Pandoraea commovens]